MHRLISRASSEIQWQQPLAVRWKARCQNSQPKDKSKLNPAVIKGQMELEVRATGGYGILKALGGRRLTLTPLRKNIGKDWSLLELIRND